MRSAYERHVQGLFARADWQKHLEDAGFQASVRPFDHSELPVGSVIVFVGTKPMVAV